MEAGSGEHGRDLDPSKALQENLESQGLFVRINQGARDEGDRVVVIYETIVLGPAEVAQAIDQANSYEGREVKDASQLHWDDLKDRPEVYEGTDRLDSVQGAIDKFFGS